MSEARIKAAIDFDGKSLTTGMNEADVSTGKLTRSMHGMAQISQGLSQGWQGLTQVGFGLGKMLGGLGTSLGVVGIALAALGAAGKFGEWLSNFTVPALEVDKIANAVNQRLHALRLEMERLDKVKLGRAADEFKNLTNNIKTAEQAAIGLLDRLAQDKLAKIKVEIAKTESMPEGPEKMKRQAELEYEQTGIENKRRADELTQRQEAINKELTAERERWLALKKQRDEIKRDNEKGDEERRGITQQMQALKESGAKQQEEFRNNQAELTRIQTYGEAERQEKLKARTAEINKFKIDQFQKSESELQTVIDSEQKRKDKEAEDQAKEEYEAQLKKAQDRKQIEKGAAKQRRAIMREAGDIEGTMEAGRNFNPLSSAGLMIGSTGQRNQELRVAERALKVHEKQLQIQEKLLVVEEEVRIALEGE